MRRTIRKIESEIHQEKLNEDLEKYRREAISLGATDSKIIKVEMIPIDDRVTLKCKVPQCFGYGTSANCPPHAIKPSELRELVKGYKYAILFKLDVRPEVIVRNRETILERVEAYKRIFEIASAIESMAFYDGYYLAAGFAAGSCKSTYCYKVECSALKGERCRNELKVRPSMEGVGIDVYKLATEVGWDIYPIGSGCDSKDIPRGSLMGLVLVN
jgi:predicted metal-binding protein